MNTLAVHAQQLIKKFGPTVALNNVSIEISQGESLAIMGASGSGKTTLLHCLAGIEKPDSGEVSLGGQNIRRFSDQQRSALRRTTCGFVFQSGQLIPELPAEENIALPLMLSGVSRHKAVKKAQDTLSLLGLEGLGARRPGELSGGQSQRVAIARALIIEPRIIFADEPTGALDSQTSHEVMKLLTSVTSKVGASLVVITHNDRVAAWCQRTVHMSDGRIVEGTV